MGFLKGGQNIKFCRSPSACVMQSLSFSPSKSFVVARGLLYFALWAAYGSEGEGEGKGELYIGAQAPTKLDILPPTPEGPPKVG